MLPSSPRTRRRLAWAGGALLAAGVAAAAISLLPRAHRVEDTVTPGPAVRHEREVKLTAGMRRGINETLDRFIPAAVLGQNPKLAWELAGPTLRGGTTRADWLTGETPVWRYPVQRTRFRDWKPLFAYRDRVAFDLLLQPRTDAKLGPIAVSVDMARTKRGWIVDSWYVSAVFSAPEEDPWVTGQADFTTEYSLTDRVKTPKFHQSRLGAEWIALPLALLGGIVVVPAALGIGTIARRRRAARAAA